ncbi:MAG: hypothetical protein E7302_13095 [Butyrivibrio sp.]|nr:hypothetical protein [Butyrivibrio sp.]
MYINIKKHILSIAIMMTAVTKICTALFEGGIRLFLNKQNISSPDMLDDLIWTSTIHHVTETLGLVFLSLYLSKRFKGL